MSVDSQRVKLKTDLAKLDTLGNTYKIDFDSACQRLGHHFTRKQFELAIDSLPVDKLPTLEAFLKSWTGLIRDAKNKLAGSGSKSFTPDHRVPVD
jgi:hypothetical protein